MDEEMLFANLNEAIKEYEKTLSVFSPEIDERMSLEGSILSLKKDKIIDLLLEDSKLKNIRSGRFVAEKIFDTALDNWMFWGSEACPKVQSIAEFFWTLEEFWISVQEELCAPKINDMACEENDEQEVLWGRLQEKLKKTIELRKLVIPRDEEFIDFVEKKSKENKDEIMDILIKMYCFDSRETLSIVLDLGYSEWIAHADLDKIEKVTSEFVSITLKNYRKISLLLREKERRACMS